MRLPTDGEAAFLRMMAAGGCGGLTLSQTHHRVHNCLRAGWISREPFHRQYQITEAGRGALRLYDAWKAIDDSCPAIMPGDHIAIELPPVPMLLTCPSCGDRHIDEGEWATKPHHTHACQSCGMVWRPAIVKTVGVQFLPGFKNVAD